MSSKYPANVFSAIVAELSGAFYQGNMASLPTKNQLQDDYISGKYPFESVNNCIESLSDASSVKLLTEQDELDVIRKMFAQGYLIENSRTDVMRQRQNLDSAELEKIDNWKQRAYTEPLKKFCITYEAVNIIGKVVYPTCTIEAISELDAAMLFGEENAGENYLIKEVKEV